MATAETVLHFFRNILLTKKCNADEINDQKGRKTRISFKTSTAEVNSSTVELNTRDLTIQVCV